MQESLSSSLKIKDEKLLKRQEQSPTPVYSGSASVRHSRRYRTARSPGNSEAKRSTASERTAELRHGGCQVTGQKDQQTCVKTGEEGPFAQSIKMKGPRVDITFY